MTDQPATPPTEQIFGIGKKIALELEKLPLHTHAGIVNMLRTMMEHRKIELENEATKAQVFSDVDTAYEVVRSNIELLKPYKAKYNDEALRVRDTVSYAYMHGGASLMDFLNAQSDYRQVQLAYVQLIGAYLTSAAQLNLAVGREVIP